MQRPPRPQGEHILSGQWTKLLIAVAWGFTVSLALFWWLIQQGDSLPHARGVALTLAILFELMLVFATRSQQPIWSIGFFSNRWMLGAVAIPLAAHLLLLYTPLAPLFHIQPLALTDWFIVVPLALTGFVVLEAWKWVQERE